MKSDDLLGTIHDAVYELLVRRGVEELTAIADTQALCRGLQRELGGRAHHLPALGREARHRDILQDLRAGLAPPAVAEKHGVHPKTVAKIAAKARPAPGDDPGLGTDDWVLK